MKQDFLHDAEKYKEKHQRKKRWYKVVTCLAAFVVFCTTYALILPAITLEKGECDIQEHTHTDACYEPAETVTKQILVCNEENLNLHKHTKDCYNENGELICGYADFVVHQHDVSCYDENGMLCCLLPEIKAHTHDQSCYTTEEDPSLICEEEEIILHEHTEDCFDENRNLICGKTQVLEHVHSDDCFESVEETVGTPTLICGMEEHVHSENCTLGQEPTISEDFVEDNTVQENGKVADIEEHSDSDIYISETETAQTEMRFTGADYTVQVCYGTDAGLPEGVTLQVVEISADSEEYQTYLAQAAAAVENSKGNSILFARFFDITFLLNGEKVEPVAPVEVTITYDERVTTGEDVSCQTVHFGKESVETLDTVTEITPNGGVSFIHMQEDFSVTGNVVIRSGNSTDIGVESLLVDYYVCIDGKWQNVGSTHTGWYGDDNVDELTDYNRDYITEEQAVSVLGSYGFDGSESNSSRVLAYQQKSGNTNLYSDTNTVEIEGRKVLPLSRNADHSGYNLYYLPKNTTSLSNIDSPEKLDKDSNGFYTVKVYDDRGMLLNSQIVLSCGAYTYDVSATGVTKWMAVMGDSMEELSGSTINLQNITAPVQIFPKEEGLAGNRKVTFKVMIDGQWENVGFLPYYLEDEQGKAYITSAMASMFFGDYGYTSDAEPGAHFGYSYDDIYKIYYASNMDYCMDINQNNIADNTKVQLWKSNATTAQIFRIWDSSDGYSYITPVENSAYHINVLGGGTTDGTKIGIHTATDAASHWRVVTNSDGTTSFYNKNAPETVCIDLPNGTVENGNQLQIWANATNRYWKLVQQYRISNAAIYTNNNNDGTYNIYLTPESNGDIVCYYLPAETIDNYVNVAESEINMDNSYWSVSVRDDTHTVYSVSELDNMVQYVENGGVAEVSVQNAAGILWSCVGGGSSVEITETQKNGLTTFVIQNITQPVEVTATKANPAFTVQYYAMIPRYATSGNNPLTVIDTSGGILPINGQNIATKSLYLEETGKVTDQNAGQATKLYRVSTKMELTKMYSDESFQYITAPGLEYYNKLKDNESYQLTQVGVLKEGKDPASQKDDDWTWYKLENGVSFTNVASEANENTILLSENTVLRLWYETTSSDYYNGTTFYDYNISSGQNSDGRWRTGITGINIVSNYGTSSNGQRTWGSYADVLAFGNANCGTGMSGYLFDGGTLNKYNSKNSDYMGCTFGLVQGLNGDGTLKYNEWIVAPKLFNEGDAQYKQTYSGSSLNFERVGDTYTLSAATLANSNGNSNTINNLQYFFNPSPVSTTVHSSIFTNNFWPMDQAAGRTDGLWGAYGNTGSFQGFTESSTGSWSNLAKNFPDGDDGRAHNWFFGMNFALSFNLTEDYVGPLEYTFFGDDDLWVFLDGKLICDIGGVHSSIGEFVNLRDYLPEGSSGQHTLSFFYTERGASGSTCYMQFTLPSVSSATTSQDTGSLQISKALSADSDLEVYKDVDYEFKVELLTSENGSPMNGTYSYGIRSDDASEVTYGTVKSGGLIKLKAGQTAVISGIPAGTFYRVTELTTEGYLTTVNNATGYITSGTIENGGTSPASFVNRPYTELPATGGTGTLPYTVGGILLIMTAIILLLYNKKKYGKERPASS